jgi:hypothetical protein
MMLASYLFLSYLTCLTNMSRPMMPVNTYETSGPRENFAIERVMMCEEIRSLLVKTRAHGARWTPSEIVRVKSVLAAP